MGIIPKTIKNNNMVDYPENPDKIANAMDSLSGELEHEDTFGHNPLGGDSTTFSELIIMNMIMKVVISTV